MSARLLWLPALLLLGWQWSAHAQDTEACSVPKDLACARVEGKCTLDDAISFRSDACVGLAWIVKRHVGYTKGDVVAPIYEYFAVTADGSPVRFEQYSAWRQELRLGYMLFPGRHGNYFAREGWTPLRDFYRRELRSDRGVLSISYQAIFPFSGEYKIYPDAQEVSSIQLAEGIIPWNVARSLAVEALQSQYGLSITNPEDFEGLPQPRLFDLAKIDGRWVFRLKYEGRRRTRPYYVYLVTVAVDGSSVTVDRRPWP